MRPRHSDRTAEGDGAERGEGREEPIAWCGSVERRGGDRRGMAVQDRGDVGRAVGEARRGGDRVRREAGREADQQAAGEQGHRRDGHRQRDAIVRVLLLGVDLLARQGEIVGRLVGVAPAQEDPCRGAQHRPAGQRRDTTSTTATQPCPPSMPPPR